MRQSEIFGLDWDVIVLLVVTTIFSSQLYNNVRPVYV